MRNACTVIGMVWSDLVLVWSRPPRLGLVWGFLKTMVGPVLMVWTGLAINRSGWLNLRLMQLEIFSTE